MRRLGIARGRRSVRRLAVAVVTLGLLASGAALQASAGVPLSVGETYAHADGFGFTGSAEWDIDVVNAPTWSFNETRTASGTDNGRSWTATVAAVSGFDLATDDAGILTEFHASHRADASINNDGDSDYVLSLDVPFRATAGTTIHVQATFDASVQTGGQADAYGTANLAVYCLDPGAPTGMSRIEVRATVESDEGAAPVVAQDPPVDMDLPTASGDCHVLLASSATVSGSDESSGRSTSTAGFDITVTAGQCALSGVVRDGNAEIDGHDNPMPGILVELYDIEDDTATGYRAVSDAEGRYCLRGVEPADYELRAALADAAHDPSIFRTREGATTLPPTIAFTVIQEDLGRDDVHVEFASDAERPLLADLAAIHRESARFVDWILESGVATAAELGHFDVSANGAGTHYVVASKLVSIDQIRTPYIARNDAMDICPENCEWHEIAHHVAHQLGIADTTNTALCFGRIAAHGGWRNGGTCDSMQEGFAAFLATLASLDIDAGRDGGYATPEYGSFGSFEYGAHRPWSLVTTAERGVQGREDLAVSQLLWDLSDATPEEPWRIAVADPASVFETTDAISLDGPALVRLLASNRVYTLRDLHVALTGSDLVPPELLRPSINLDGDEDPEVSVLDAAFLEQDFHPVADIANPWYRIGDPVALTDRQPVDTATGRPPAGVSIGTAQQRNDVAVMRGAAIELVNPSGAPVTFTVEIAYPASTSRFEIVVGPGETQVVERELPPYWRGVADPDSLPACDAATDRPVSMTISGGGAAPKTIANCEYLQLAASATTDFALSYRAIGGGAASGSGAPVPPGQPGSTNEGLPILALAAGGVVLVGAVVLFLAVRRRGAKPGAPTG